MIPGSAGKSFDLKVEQAKAGAFMTAIQQLRGMGALSNAEGQTATAAVTRLNTADTEEGFLAALNDYERVIRSGMERAQGRINKGSATGSGAETFEQFAAQPSAIAASQKYGVSLEEMWAIKQGQK